MSENQHVQQTRECGIGGLDSAAEHAGETSRGDGWIQVADPQNSAENIDQNSADGMIWDQF